MTCFGGEDIPKPGNRSWDLGIAKHGTSQSTLNGSIDLFNRHMPPDAAGVDEGGVVGLCWLVNSNFDIRAIVMLAAKV